MTTVIQHYTVYATRILFLTTTLPHTFLTLLHKFNSLVSFAAATPNKLMITGDLNIHLDNDSDNTTCQFLSIL